MTIFESLAFGRGFHLWAIPEVKTQQSTEREARMKQALLNVVTNPSVMVLCIVISQVIAFVRAVA